MDRLIEIANDLGKLYKDLASVKLDAWDCDNQIAIHKLSMVPDDGWPGKNAEQRKVAEEQAYQQDLEMQALVDDAHDYALRIALTEADIKALEIERRALEWQIRAQMVAALRNQVEEQPVEYTVFDQVADNAMVEEAAEELPF